MKQKHVSFSFLSNTAMRIIIHVQWEFKCNSSPERIISVQWKVKYKKNIKIDC